MAITCIDFHVDDHLVQVSNGTISIFKNGDTKKKPIEFDASEISRILKVASEQIEGNDEYAIAV